MLLQKIVLNNFRQFYGEQEIEFSCDKARNVTLIHAENGVGKTTLLNALLWCFYNDTSARFENPENIVCNQAIEEKDFKASVEVFFEHDGSHYLVSRTTNSEFAEESFDAFLIDGGDYQKLNSAMVFVETVIPKEMSKYFFFDGEYAEAFASSNNRREVRVAVESMLGCNIALQASKDIAAIERKLEKEIAALTKNDRSATFQSSIDKLSSQMQLDENEITRIESDLEQAKNIKKNIEETLRNTEGAKEIQEKKEKLEQRRKDALDEKAKIEARETKWIDHDSIGLLSKKLHLNCINVIEEANVKGHLPSKIADTFVHDILEKGICICDREFDKETKESAAISELIKEAGTAVLSDRLMNIRSRMGKLEQAHKVSVDNFGAIHQDFLKVADKIDDYELGINECKQQLQGSNVREIAERQLALSTKEAEIENMVGKKARLKKACEDAKIEIDEMKKKRDKLLLHNDRAKNLQYKTAILSATSDKLDAELDNYRETSRSEINEKVNKILRKTARRDYYSSIDGSFNLDMFYGSTELPVAKSGGENQLLSLAFIASLVEFAANRRTDESHLLKPGTMAPLMLDSPFGQLDPTYRQSTAEFLPNSSGQVILLLSKTQGDDDVIKVLEDKIGSEYILISENRSERGDKPEDIVTVKGEQIACSVYEAEKDRTIIKQIL